MLVIALSHLVLYFTIALCSGSTTAEPLVDGLQQICRQPRLSGHCEKPQTRWGYDPSTGRCHEFVYNGCMGNLNNFLQKEDCEKICQGVAPCRGLEVMPYGCIVTELADGPEGCPDFKIDCSNYPRRFPQYPKVETTETSAPSLDGVENTPQEVNTDT